MTSYKLFSVNFPTQQSRVVLLKHIKSKFVVDKSQRYSHDTKTTTLSSQKS